MFFWNKFCGFVFSFLFMAFISTAQNSKFVRFNNNTFLLKNKFKGSDSLIHFTSPLYVLYGLKDTRQPVPENFYTNNMSFFCRQELVIEKATKIPFRFRLGSLQQCNYYEGKKQ